MLVDIVWPLVDVDAITVVRKQNFVVTDNKLHWLLFDHYNFTNAF